MPTRPSTSLEYRLSYRAAALTGAAVLLLYVLTLAPSTAMWDTSEYISAAYTLGIPHPPGNPMFVLLGRVFALLPIASNVAARVNLLAAISSAISAGLWFLVAERVLAGWFPSRWPRIAGGVVAAMLGATAFTDWNQSVVNEKVYTVALLGLALVSWLIVRWIDTRDKAGADRLLVLAAYLSGLGYGVHMAGMLAAPAAIVAVLLNKPRTLLRWRLLLAVGGAAILGMTPFATQPIRAAFHPAINEGEPTACRDGLHASCTFSEGTYNAFMYNFERLQYGKPSLGVRQAPIAGQLAMWWYYFKWQWMRDPFGSHPFAQSALAALFFVLGLAGGWAHWKRERATFWYFGTLMATLTVVLIYYLNFKYGATQPGNFPLDAREVRDRDYFFIWSFSAWGVWAGVGLLYLWETLASFVGLERVKVGAALRDIPTRRALRLASPILALALIPLVTNWAWAPRTHQTDTLDFAHDMLDSVEPYGVLVTAGDNDTFPLWYAQEVEHIRNDVVVANTSLLNTDWYDRGIVRRAPFAYDAAAGPAVYRSQPWRMPTEPVLHLALSAFDTMPDFYPLQAPADFDVGTIHTRFFPDSLPELPIGGHGFQRADVLVLQIIKDTWPNRPIYFAKSTGQYASMLGLGRYVLEQGLAAKLMPAPVTIGGTIGVDGATGYALDIPRTKELWFNDFRAPASLAKRGSWIDEPSRNIPWMYLRTSLDLYANLHQLGDTAGAHAAYQATRSLAGMLRVSDALTPER